MLKADLHVHSSYSSHPSIWFLQRLGASESYVEPLKVYENARKRGMDLVTITDHNSIKGSLVIKERYPENVITGVESTAYFPEDHTKIHILIYGIENEQFNAVERLRKNIYKIRDYLKEQDIAHSVAHATYSVNNRLRIDHVEKLMLLFDHFEGINGQRTRRSNETFINVVRSLTPEKMDRLFIKYKIEPVSSTPWIKGLTAGSDDHSGLFPARAWTAANASTPEEFVNAIKRKETLCNGRHCNYQEFAFAIYKVSYDFSQSKKTSLTSSLFSAVNSLVFSEEKIGLRKRLHLKKIRFSKSAREDRVKGLFIQLVETFQKNHLLPVEKKLDILSDALTNITDEFLRIWFENLEKTAAGGDIVGFIRNISGSLPGLFLSLPFFTTLHLTNSGRGLGRELKKKFNVDCGADKKRVLWFTDTLADLNGVSESLRKIAWLCDEKGLELKLVSSLLEHEKGSHFPPNIINLPCVKNITPSFFKTYTLRIPSVLGSLKKIYDYDPDEIYISTPGPVGILGLLMSRLLHIPSTSIYHTDFTSYAKKIIDDDSITNIVQEYCRWFFNSTDSIKVPAREYITLLEKRGYRYEKMSIFNRGIDTDKFKPLHGGSDRHFVSSFDNDKVILLYAGRISREKNLDFLISVYERLSLKYENIHLTLAGDGPYYDEFRQKTKRCKNIEFLGRVTREELIPLYGKSDCFVFPSTTDTFGMVILEAQACGLPAVVSDRGGPKEIILNGKTGYVASANSVDDWVKKVGSIIKLKRSNPVLVNKLRDYCRRNVLSRYSWGNVLADIFDERSFFESSKKESKKNYQTPESLAAVY